MKKLFNKENIIFDLMTAAVIIYTAVYLVRIFLAAGQTGMYPNEYREAANIAMTQSILNGVNPYSLSTLSSDIPAVCYLYGPLMSLIAVPFAWLLPGVSLWTIHYDISIASIIISAVLVGIMVKEHSRRMFAPACAFLLTIFCHWRYGYVYGAPDSLGLCVMIAVLFVLSRGVDTGACDDKSILVRFKPEIAALLTVASLFTKQYFLMVAATGAVYLFYINRKQFLRYAASGIVISGILFSIITVTCPLYWTYAIYFLKGPGAGAAMGKTGISYNNMQISYLGGMLLMLFIAALAALIAVARGIITKKPVKNQRFLMLFWIHAVIAVAVLRYIGNNDGAFLSYYLQLFTPALIVISVCALDSLEIPVGSARMRTVITALACLIFIGYTIYKVEPRLIINRLSDEEMGQWQQAYDMADRYVGAGDETSFDEALTGSGLREDIYYFPPLNYHGYTSGEYVYNDGQPFVFSEKFARVHSESPLMQKLFPHAGEVINQHLKFREQLRSKVLNGDYELVMNLPETDVVFTEEDLSVHYKKEAVYSLRTGNWAWDIDFWVKK